MKLPIHQGYYTARSPIASAQVAYNIYPEPNPPDAPFPVTSYPAPGLRVLSDYTGQIQGFVRGIYNCSNGQIVAVVGEQVLNWQGEGNTPIIIGSLPSDTGQPVSMVDNGQTLVIVDGTGGGWTAPINALNPGNLTAISDPAFYGSPRVDFIDTFLIFTQPGTGNFYTSTSNVVTPFDPLYIAGKEGWNDRLVTAACLHDNIWLLGNVTTEIWFNAGGAAFPFARMPNSILQQGCVATYSPVVADNALYWLSQDRWGRNMCMRGEGYAARRVSTFAVEDEWAKYPTLHDAVGMSFQLGGHEYVCFRFPSANAFWVYDASTQMWHKRTAGGTNFATAWQPYCIAGWGAVAYTDQSNAIIAGDATAPRILQISRDIYTDIGFPIERRRSWMHQQQDGQRINYTRFALSMAGNQMSPDTVTLDWSDDAGLTYGAGVPQTINNQSNGQYLWRRLGYARDRVYRTTWVGQGEFALNGAYSDGVPEAT